MAKKAATVFMCRECGYESPQWMGKCICGAWNSMVEMKVQPEKPDARRRTGSGTLGTGSGADTGRGGSPIGKLAGRPVPLRRVSSSDTDRLGTGIAELDRVLGGGLVRGSLTLLSGEPGIGKSTLILQAAVNIAKTSGTVLYVSGEESEEQIRSRADRICDDLPENLLILAETNMENILLQFETLKPAFLIIDSIQTMYSEELDSAPGSVSQVRVVGNELMRIGKGYETPVLIVAHVTKSGELAGPKTVEHLVDTVLSFTGERHQDLRILRAAKNRFGATNEIGAFEMCEEGLREVRNLSEAFMEDMDSGAEGSVATAVYEGTRPLILEIQALTAPTNMNFPRRTAVGIDLGRLNMILAVLERRVGVSLYNQDVYINIVGGIRPGGTSVDLALALAVYSSYKGIVPPERVLSFGEIGLTGEIRSVPHADKILREAASLGFRSVMLPAKTAERLKKSGFKADVEIIGVATLRDAIDKISGLSRKTSKKR